MGRRAQRLPRQELAHSGGTELPERYLTEELPGIGGTIKERVEDFCEMCGNYVFIQKKPILLLKMVLPGLE